MKKSTLIILCLVMMLPAAYAQSGKSVVHFWYLWGGAEGQVMEDNIADFNKSQTKYEVKGLSVPDMQKIIVGISSGNGPDITDDFSSNLASYASKGTMLDLGPYIAKAKYDIGDFIPAAMQACSYDGKTYALPMSMNFMMLFYNRKLFAEVGLKTPPKTDKEMLEYAIKLTKTNKDGSLATLGFPDFPIVYYLNHMTTALGGNFISPDGKKLTPDNAGTIAALNMLVAYRQKFGTENVDKFRSSGYLSVNDPFVDGRQAMRIDGAWFGSSVKGALKNTTLDYGVAPLPYPDGHPELARSSLVDASIFYIPSNAKNKDGAWAFLAWFMGKKQLARTTSKMGNFPARFSCLEDPIFNSAYDFQAFAEQARSKNLKTFPAISAQREYSKIMADEAELAWNLKKSVPDAMRNAAKLSVDLLNQE